jgi:ATP:ADP antiporter, AAA family
MTNQIQHLFRLRPGEGKTVFLLGFLLLSNSMALAIANIVSVSGFLSEVGVNELLLVWIADMVLIFLATGAQSLIVDRFERITLLRWMTFIFAVIYVMLRLLFVFGVPGWFNYTLLFLLVDQQYIFFPLIFWIFANDALDIAQTKRLFPVIASFSFVGRILGFGLSAIAPNLLDRLSISSTELLSLNVLIYLITYLVIAEGLGSIKVRETVAKQETVREALMEGWGFIRDVLSFRFLTLAMLMLSLGFTIVEFHFFVISDKEITDLASFQTFYSVFNLVATVAAITLQGLLTSRLINALNLRNTFFIFPLFLLIGIVIILLFPNNIFVVVLGLALPKLIKETVDQSARSSFQALVPEERRGRVSMFMDSYLFATGAILGSLVAGAAVLLGDQISDQAREYIYLTVVLISTLLALWFTRRMTQEYDSSLLNWRLKRRTRGSDVLNKLEF